MVRRVLVLVLVAMLWPAVAQAAYVTPTSRSTGFVVTAARWNQDVVDNMIAVRTAVLDSVVNETAATDMTITATGDEIIFADQIKLLGTTSDPTNEQDVSYDTTDGAIQAKYKIGRVKLDATFHQVNADTTITTNGSDQTFTEATFPLPLSVCQDGMSIDFDFGGVFTSNGTPGTYTFKIVKGSTTLLTCTGLTPGTSQTNKGWRISGTISGRSTTTATIHAQALLGAANLSDRNHNVDSTVGAVTFGTAAEDLKLVINLANSGQSITLQSGYWRIH